MPVELAVALAAIAAKTLVAELIQNGSMNNAGWANVSGQVIDALVTSSSRQESGLQELSRKIDQVGKQIDRVGKQINDMPVREFELHMAAGRRYLRDLPVEWRGKRDRRHLIRDARHEFVQAVAIAELNNDLERRVSAEVAIAGCWLWVPSLEDVKNTIGAARKALEQELLFGATLPTASYRDVLQMCRSYREQPPYTGFPIQTWSLPGRPVPPTPGARIAVLAAEKRWVRCAGVDLRIDSQPSTIARPAALLAPSPALPAAATAGPSAAGWPRSAERTVVPARLLYGQGRPGAPRTPPQTEPESPWSSGNVTITVRNKRAESISVSRTPQAVIARLPMNNTLPDENRIAPGAKSTLTLPPPEPGVGTNLGVYYQPVPAIGFVWPLFRR